MTIFCYASEFMKNKTIFFNELIFLMYFYATKGSVPVAVPVPEQQPFSIGNVLVRKLDIFSWLYNLKI